MRAENSSRGPGTQSPEAAAASEGEQAARSSAVAARAAEAVRRAVRERGMGGVLTLTFFGMH